MNKPEDIAPFINNKLLLDKASELEYSLRNFGLKDSPVVSES
ncbi:MAG: hypothetical protein ABIN89_15600 [Chitinophagaceae bacterium]